MLRLCFAVAWFAVGAATPAWPQPRPGGEGSFRLSWHFAGPDLQVRIANAGSAPTPAARTWLGVERGGRAVPRLGREGALGPIAPGREEQMTFRDWRRLAPGTAVFCLFPNRGVTAKLCVREVLPTVAGGDER